MRAWTGKCFVDTGVLSASSATVRPCRLETVLVDPSEMVSDGGLVKGGGRKRDPGFSSRHLRVLTAGQDREDAPRHSARS